MEREEKLKALDAAIAKLEKEYGKASLAYKEFKDIKFATNMYEDVDCTMVNKKACKEGLVEAKKLLEKLK